MKIALLGYGKMGKTIERLALQKGHTIVYTLSSTGETGNLADADCAIEFSVPTTAVANISKCFELNIPVVSGTTGWLDHYQEVLKLCETSNGSFIYASNFSIGVNLFFTMNEYLAKLMRPWKEYEPSIEEIHHTQKLDAPSGTAISIAKGILKHSDKTQWKLDSDDKNDLNITAKRIDDVKGTHSIDYTSAIDTITLKHEAHTRDGFAMGAILAAEWLVGKKGVFSMKDVLNLK
ncbi:4-hydroxy-tetrahydrodipicolinate reductase [Aureisphaera galaxeae]|uniref:4-hydroxy-tetrahydrodipicolinate reductase n=1 Tax=Aureisphaera galaxeae TaxID=1538023 RepID=UPI00234FE123|nr:4-hydroxy-tetrahydrodipicolinate reductase [Aureisphaera galaxeae]MDC8003489.1 4-hydroxy-tetrahydrodipicolinate reductase [Aureisphaera galaxeae]